MYIMDSIQSTVYYCCVSRSDRLLYTYSCGDTEVENLASLCLERVPPFHSWYTQTMGKKTFGFLMEDECVYFTIVAEGLENPGVLQFLHNVRDEFKKAAKKGSRGTLSGLNSVCVQEQLLPVIRRLITSLENVSPPEGIPSPLASPTGASANGQIGASSSTRAPLLGKPHKHDKKKTKDHVIAMRDIELEEHRKSTDKGVNIDSGSSEANSQNSTVSSAPVHKDSGSMRIRSGATAFQKKWCHQVRIILAIDVAVCIILLVIWLYVCSGIVCLQ